MWITLVNARKHENKASEDWLPSVDLDLWRSKFKNTLTSCEILWAQYLQNVWREFLSNLPQTYIWTWWDYHKNHCHCPITWIAEGALFSAAYIVYKRQSLIKQNGSSYHTLYWSNFEKTKVFCNILKLKIWVLGLRKIQEFPFNIMKCLYKQRKEGKTKRILRIKVIFCSQTSNAAPESYVKE